MPKILAIDDINDNLISLKAIITDAFPGASVFTALNGIKGIELAIANDPDVILLDIIMPGMDGFEVCRRLKGDERVRDIPVVFVTAIKGDKESRIKALEVGADGFLTKPIDEPELIAQIRAMVKIKAATDQKRQEKDLLKTLVAERTRELENSQAQLKGIFDNLQDAYFQADLSGHFTIVSPSAVKIYGFESIDELIGQPAEMLYFDLQDRNSMLSVLHSAGRIRDFVCQARKKDGSPFWASMNVQLIYGSDGEILGTEGVVRDITERKQAEEELRVRKEDFRQIIERSNEIFYRQNLVTGQFEYVSPKVYDILGYTTEEFLVQDFKQQQEAIHPEDLPQLVNFVNDLVQSDKQNQKFITREYRIKNKKGDYIWVRGNYILVRDKENNPAKVIGSLTNITHRKQAEEALKESEAQFREFFEKAADAIFIAEIETGILVDANEAASRLLLMPRNQIVGLHQTQLHPPDKEEFSKETFHDHKKTIMQEEIAIPFENYVIRSDGSLKPVEILAAEVLYKGKKCLQGTFRDITERKASEEALLESEEKYRRMVDLSPDAVIIHAEGKIVFANASTYRLTGATSSDQLIGKPVLDFVHPDSRVHAYARIKKIYETGEPSGFAEEKFITFNNEVLDAEVIGIPVYNMGKSAIQTIIRNITDRRRAEEALWESQLNFKALFEKGPIGVAYHRMIYNEAGKPVDYLFLDANQSYQRLTGVNPVGKLVTEAFPGIENDTFDWIGTFGEVAKTGKEVKFQQHLEANDRWYDCVGYQYRPDHFVAAFFEITEQRKAEIALNESNEFNDYLLQSIPFGMNIVDEQGNILFQNENMIRHFGASSNKSKCWELYRDDKCQCPECPLFSGIQIGKTDVYETGGVIGGKTFQISHTGMSFQGKKAMLEIFQDITERKGMEKEIIEAKEKAEESDRLKSAFLANMSHEIRTPLNSIIGFSELMTDPDFENDQQFDFARMIHSSGVHLLSIISDIMDLSKIEAGQVHVNKNTFSVNQLISRIQKEYSFEAIAKNIELRVAPGMRNEILLESDEPKLRQVLINFVGNAIKFTKTGYIEIGAEEVNGMIRFHVKDTGIGIPAKYHEHVFERFRQVEAADTRKYGGNGLGLAISKSLVELLSGKIWMESEEGKGSIFYFAIPHPS